MMDKISVMLVEDEAEIRNILRKMIEKQDGFYVKDSCGSFSEALNAFSADPAEVVFMDIDLAGESGLDCARVMTQIRSDVKIIFATAHSEYMANAFEIYAFDYLLKPFRLERIARTLQRIRAGRTMQTEQEKKRMMIKGKDQIHVIDKSDIILIERMDGMTSITTQTEVLQTAASLSSLEEKLDPGEFLRCHKSYIVNLSRIVGLEPYGRWTYVVKLKGTRDTALMTSQKYEEFKKMFE